ncbi:TraB/GumN family protein [Sulfitobacter sp. S190]|uniref:TraB/GumN family protein n=1 Tax=Sulfitobacter sp. S190 TaxID=2867022 RepID=UPI0021A388B7|nr:TraB/GumN family protein [Sulfitobacter sp. S190]UWR23139.1 TraB/GumN family protein [Sulfitobacter sp. S190]
MRFLFYMVLLLLPFKGWTACSGEDLRDTLTDAQQRELAAEVAQTPYPRGNHWTATRDGRTVHVIGTLHISDDRLDPIAARLATVVRAADTLLVEANEDAHAQLREAVATQPDLAFLPGKTLIDLLPPDDWTRVAAAAQARGIPSFVAAKFQPWYMSITLSMAPCVAQSVAAGETGLDARLMAVADAAGVPVLSLEPYDTVFAILGADPLDEQLRMLRLGTPSVAQANNSHATLVAQYLEEDIAAALALSRIAGRTQIDLPQEEFDRLFDALMADILDTRNLSWIAPIEAAPGSRIVVAVGALHLTGETGLLNQLERRGYTLQRQPF